MLIEVYCPSCRLWTVGRRCPTCRNDKPNDAPARSAEKQPDEDEAEETVRCACGIWSLGRHCHHCGRDKPTDAPTRRRPAPQPWPEDDDVRWIGSAYEPVAQPAISAEEAVRCPRCRSGQVIASATGYGVGKALLGLAALGPVGLVAGAVGSSKPKASCLKCGHRWKPGSH